MSTGFVALLDVLGFSALLSDEGEGQLLKHYLKCINEALNDAWGGPQVPELNYVVFSDSIVLVPSRMAPITELKLKVEYLLRAER